MPIVKWSLTHRGNVLDNADELVKDNLCGNVVLIDRIATCNGVEGVVWEILARLSLQLRGAP